MESWGVSFTSAMTETSCSGTVAANGMIFDAGSLSLNATRDANAATLSVFGNGIRNVMENTASWTSTGGDNCTFDGFTGVSWTTTIPMSWSPRVPMTWTGTIVTNGTTFDPKTLYF